MGGAHAETRDHILSAFDRHISEVSHHALTCAGGVRFNLRNKLQPLLGSRAETGWFCVQFADQQFARQGIEVPSHPRLPASPAGRQCHAARSTCAQVAVVAVQPRGRCQPRGPSQGAGPGEAGGVQLAGQGGGEGRGGADREGLRRSRQAGRRWECAPWRRPALCAARCIRAPPSLYASCAMRD